jgi:hypothetical protein
MTALATTARLAIGPALLLDMAIAVRLDPGTFHRATT